jgi:hypothetical protein
MKTFFLIGGGQSALEVEVRRLRPLRQGGVIIGINDAAFHKRCDIFFSNDHGYALSVKQEIEKYDEAYLSVRQKHMHMFENWNKNVCIWRRVDEENPCTRPCMLSSGPPGTPGCSGYVALNLAAQLGAKRIILFGYDFHDQYKYFFNNDLHERKSILEVRKSFMDVAPWYAARGIEIFNANPNSSIEAFRKISHQEAYDL